MRRLLRLIALLPMLTIVVLVIYKVTISAPKTIPDYYWLVVAMISLPAAFIKLDNIRDGIIGLLYSGIIANFLLFISSLLVKSIDNVTAAIFIGYLLSVYLIVVIDIVYDKFLNSNKSTDVFSSFDNPTEYRIDNEK